MLRHATHDEQAEQIRQNARRSRQYHFKVHRKYGKSYDNHNHFGESYCYTPETSNEDIPGADTPCYRPIPDTEPIFPGYYSWWGLAVDPQDRQPSIDNKYLPPYLKSPAESVYGNNAFNASFSDLLQSYASSRGCGVEDIYLKVGGTLRYKCEIAYVVIVCTSHDLEALNSYCPITCAPPDVFNPNGLADSTGKVIDMTKIPYFTTRYMNTYVSYETLNFAFYFNEGEYFKCPSVIVEFSEIEHEFCIRSKPMKIWFDRHTMQFIKKQVCNYMQKYQKKHVAAISFARRCGVE